MTGNSNNKADTPMLIEWISTIYGIYFGIWLGFFVEQLFIKQAIVQIQIPFFSVDLVNIGFSIIIGVYTYYFVKYMWRIRNVTPTQQFRTVVKRFVGAPILVLVTDLAIFFIGYIFKIDKIWTGMGIWATISWVLVLGFAVLSDRRGW